LILKGTLEGIRQNATASAMASRDVMTSSESDGKRTLDSSFLTGLREMGDGMVGDVCWESWWSVRKKRKAGCRSERSIGEAALEPCEGSGLSRSTTIIKPAMSLPGYTKLPQEIPSSISNEEEQSDQPTTTHPPPPTAAPGTSTTQPPSSSPFALPPQPVY
jgi:hypothetical protein